MRILITGGRGFLGSYLAQALSDAGHEVLILTHRIPTGSMMVYGDITRPGLDMPPWQWPQAIVNCAGLVSFRRNDAQRLGQLNVEGARNVGEVARSLDIPLYHVSTAYAEGDKQRGFRNFYEESKYLGEQALQNIWGLKLTILRPAILVGDSQVKGVPPLNGLYSGIRAVSLAKRALERGLALPPLEPAFRLSGNPQGLLNLVPVDVAADQIAEIISGGHTGEFYIVNESPPAIAEVISAASQVLGARLDLYPPGSPPEDLTPADRLIHHLMESLVPYLAGDSVFDNQTTRAVCTTRCLGVSYDFIKNTTRQFLLHQGSGGPHARRPQELRRENALRQDAAGSGQAGPDAGETPQ